jgi:RHS repeat-associated protein
MRQGDVVYYLHTDHLGSTSLTTDITGTLVAETRYLPYGEERWTNEAQPTDFTFTGQRAEAGFRLMDYNARYYDPGLGRFVSADTVVPEAGNPQALNRYSYVLNSPLKYADPTGHCWDPLTGSADTCIAAWQRAVDAYEAGERRPGVLALHASGITDRLVATSEKINRLNQDADLVFSNAPVEERLLPSVRLGVWAVGTAAAVVGVGQLAKAGLQATPESTTVKNLELHYKPGWDSEQIAAADRKVDALNKAAQEGRLFKTEVERSGTSAAARYRSSGGQLSPDQDVDHVIDLQLGGSDTLSNMAPLDRSVNRSFGSQIYRQLMDSPIGTIIQRVIIK